MDKNRYSKWIENSLNLRWIDFLLVDNAQGLGILDVELIEEFPNLKINSSLEADRLKKLRHITISELWMIGAYELVRLIDRIANRYNSMIQDVTKKEIKQTLGIFTQIRIPCIKFEKPGKEHTLYSQIADSFLDQVNGVGWKIYPAIVKEKRVKERQTKLIYRKELGDILLKLLGLIKTDIS